MGWLESGIPFSEAEDVAQHSFETISITTIIGNQLKKEGIGINLEKAIKIAIIHDWGEAIIGDISLKITTELGEEVKDKIERESFDELVRDMPNGEEYLELWMDYSRRESIESRLVRSADLLSILIELTNYLNTDNYNDELRDIWENVQDELMIYSKEFQPVKNLLIELNEQYKIRDA